MGVRGLMTFVENNQGRLYDKEKLHDCPLVIDGFGLTYHLYFESNLDSRHGGEFAAFSEVISRFFKQLKICKIEPFVIFDGPIEPDKLPCVLTRLNDRVNDVNNILKNEERTRARVLPIFAVDVLFHHLMSHQIKYAVSLTDADCEIVAAANALHCPVLSLDSDYYIFNIENGYVPFTHFYWDKIWTDKGSNRKSIISHKYKIGNMVKEYGVPEPLLPYISILLGNDWLPKDTFQELLAKLPQPKSSQRQKSSKRRKHDQKIDSLLWWLSTKSNEKSVLDKIRFSLPNKKREEIMSKVDVCLSLYRTELDVSETMNILKKNEPQKTPDQDEIRYLVRTSNVHPTAINILDSKYICLPVPMHDSRKASPHACAAAIRTLYYRLLLRKFRFKNFGPEFLFIQEYDKVDLCYKKSRTVSVFTSLCPLCDQHHSLDEVCVAISSDGIEKCAPCVKMILKLLQFESTNSFLIFMEKRNNFEFFNEDFMKVFDIVMTMTLFWFKKTTPNTTFICSLLLTVVWSVSKCLNKKANYCSRKEMTKTTQASKMNNAMQVTGVNTIGPKLNEVAQPEVTSTNQKSGDTRDSYKLKSQPITVQEQVTSCETNPTAAENQPLGPPMRNSPIRPKEKIVPPFTTISVYKFLDLIGSDVLQTASGSRETLHSEMDIDLLHSASEWLCTLNAAILLHQVAESQRSNVAMQDFFISNMFLHDVHTRLKRLTSAEDMQGDLRKMSNAVADCLATVPRMKSLFIDLADYLLLIDG
ncbi:uncharacterized protein LOC120336591 [Styela clava]